MTELTGHEALADTWHPTSSGKQATSCIWVSPSTCPYLPSGCTMVSVQSSSTTTEAASGLTRCFMSLSPSICKATAGL